MDPSCPLTLQANGGNGGNVNNSVFHGGGGGGGQGSILFLEMVPLGNVTATTLNGAGGCDNNVMPCASAAGSGEGLDNMGVGIYGVSPLPIRLLSFDAIDRGEYVEVVWEAAGEMHDGSFEVERSTDGLEWVSIHRSTGGPGLHNALDMRPWDGLAYYRLKQVDPQAGTSFSHVVPVQRWSSIGTFVHPNPVQGIATLHLEEELEQATLRIFNDLGQVAAPDQQVSGQRIGLDLTAMTDGLYVFVLMTGQEQRSIRVLVQH